MLAVANRCFKSMTVPKGTKLQLDLSFVASGRVATVYTESTAATPRALQECIEAAAWKIQFGPGKLEGRIADGFVSDSSN